jgi:hypothetical protein
LVKIKNPPNLKYVPFEEEECYCYHEEEYITNKELYSSSPDYSSKRVYKGEGTLNFIAYSPFARSRFKYKDYYNPENCPELELMDSPNYSYYNLEAWIGASGLKNSTDYFTLDSDETLKYFIDVPRS